jgi:hypothetical protein
MTCQSKLSNETLTYIASETRYHGHCQQQIPKLVEYIRFLQDDQCAPGYIPMSDAELDAYEAAPRPHQQCALEVPELIAYIRYLKGKRCHTTQTEHQPSMVI